MTKELEQELNAFSQKEIKKSINHMEILLDLNYALPDSVITESEDGEGYVFSFKDKKEFLTKEQLEKLLLTLKVLQL